MYYNAQASEVGEDFVTLRDGRLVAANVAVWSTGAEPQQIIARSDLDQQNGYFKVNDHLQSTKFSNIFAGGDCISMDSHPNQSFPPKAGVYAVREGPIIA